MLHDCYWFITLIMQWWWLAKALKGLILILILIRNRLCTTYLGALSRDVTESIDIWPWLCPLISHDVHFSDATRDPYSNLIASTKSWTKETNHEYSKTLKTAICCWRLAHFKFTQKFSAVAKVSGNSISFIHTKCDFHLSCFKLSDEFVFERVLFNFAEVAFP